MPSTYSSLLRIELPANFEQQGLWGNTTNRNLGTLIETAIAGSRTIALPDMDYTLVASNGVDDEARYAMLVFTGSLTTTRNVIVPSTFKMYRVLNSTNQPLVIKTATGVGRTVPVNATVALVVDATGVVDAFNNVSLTTLTTSGTVTLNGGTANGVAYLNGSKVLTTGSALTFDGSTLSGTGNFKVGGGVATNTDKLMVNTVTGVAAGIQLFQDGIASWSMRNPPNSAALVWSESAVEYMRLTSTGLGIGLTPIVKLDVGTSGGSRVRFDTSNPIETITTHSNFAGGAFTVAIQDALTHLWRLSGSEQMRLTSTGLGIGTSAPTARLHVRTNTNINGVFVNGPAGTEFEMRGVNDAGNLFIPVSLNGSVLRFYNQNSLSATLDQAGNLGLGVTPSAWASTVKAIQIGTTSSVFYDGANNTYWGNNNYFDGAFKLLSNGTATTYVQTLSGEHRWLNSIASTAGAPISFTQAMTLTQGGNLLVGTTVDAGNRLRLVPSTADADVLRWENQAGTLTAALGVNTANGYLYSIATSNHAYVLGTNNLERARITSAGNLLVGTTGLTTGVSALEKTLVLRGSATNEAASFVAVDQAGLGATFLATDNAGNGYVYTKGGAPLLFGTNNTERARIDPAGNFGLNTPLPPNSTYPGLFLPQSGYFDYLGNGGLFYNTYTTGVGQLRYRQSGLAATWYNFNQSGEHEWYTAPSGTAGALVTFTRAMALTQGGNLLIGTGANSARLTVSSGLNPWFVFDAGNTSNSYGSFNNQGIPLGFIGAGQGGAISGGTATDFAIRAEQNLLFASSGNNERARITSAGNLLVGTTVDTTDRLRVTDASSDVFISGGQFSSNRSPTTGAITNNARFSQTILLSSASGEIGLFTSPSPGAQVIERARITATGNLLVGTTVDNGNRLNVFGNAYIQGNSPSSPTTAFIINNDVNGSGRLILANGASNSEIQHFNDSQRFVFNAVERARITSAGNLLVGTTSVLTNERLRLNPPPQEYSAVFSNGVTDPNFFFATRAGDLGSAAGTSQGRIGVGYIGVSNMSVGFDFLRGGATTDTTLAIVAGNAERVRITSAGNLLVGTTSDNGKRIDARGNGTQTIRAVSDNGGIAELDLTSLTNFSWRVQGASDSMRFLRDASELARITSAGYLKASNTGTYNDSAAAYHESRSDQNGIVHLFSSTNTGGSVSANYTVLPSGSSGYHYRSQLDASVVYQVLANGNVQNTNNSYGAISDAKLKENVTDATPKLAQLNQLRVVNYNLIGDDLKQIGLIAQEVEQVFPALVESTPDIDPETKEPTGTVTKSVKYSVLVPMLLKAVQELTAKIAALEAA